MARLRPLVLTAVGLAMVGAILIFGGRALQRSFFYPKPENLPPVVTASTEELLARLQQTLETHAPRVARSLQTGLPEAQIHALETAGSFSLTPDLRAFYRWHDGTKGLNSISLLPGHHFAPLADVVRERDVLAQQLRTISWSERATFAVFAGHRPGWISILPDGSGDGYFYDQTRAEHEGAFFYHFAEDRTYLWFPSFRNFLAGLIECYESGAIKPSSDGKSLEEEVARTALIWQRFALSRE